MVTVSSQQYANVNVKMVMIWTLADNSQLCNMKLKQNRTYPLVRMLFELVESHGSADLVSDSLFRFTLILYKYLAPTQRRTNTKKRIVVSTPMQKNAIDTALHVQRMFWLLLCKRNEYMPVDTIDSRTRSYGVFIEIVHYFIAFAVVCFCYFKAFRVSMCRYIFIEFERRLRRWERWVREQKIHRKYIVHAVSLTFSSDERVYGQLSANTQKRLFQLIRAFEHSTSHNFCQYEWNSAVISGFNSIFVHMLSDY